MSNAKPNMASKDSSANNRANKPNKSINSNKASKEGIDFQYHLYFYVLGLCHDKYKYSTRYEGEMATYGALDDVILKIYGEDHVDGAKPKALYLFQAKQKQDGGQSMSIMDLLNPKDGFTKYMESYEKYSSSKTQDIDGSPTEMIYWTSMDMHSSTAKMMAEFQSSEQHLRCPIIAGTAIKKFWIKDWKKLFIYEIAAKLVACAQTNANNSTKPDSNKTETFKCQSVAVALLRETVEQVEVRSKSGVIENKLRLRKRFLDRDVGLSSHAATLRDCVDLVLKLKNTWVEKPDTSKLEAATFDNVFGVDNFDGQKVDEACTFEYLKFDEEKLSWFFAHFVYYTNVPKNEPMIASLNKMFNGNFNVQLFEKHLIPKPLTESTFIDKSFVDSLLQTVKITTELLPPAVRCVQFSEKSLHTLHDTIKAFVQPDLSTQPASDTVVSSEAATTPTLTVVATTNLDWTVSRVANELRKTPVTFVVVQNKDLCTLEVALETIDKNLVLSELQIIVAVDIASPLTLPLGIKVISIVPQMPKAMDAYFVDQINFEDVVRVRFEQFEDRKLLFDDKEIDWTKFGDQMKIDNIEKLVELYNLEKLEVKSDVYEYDERHYIERALLDDKKRNANFTAGAQQVAVISDTAGQGKSTELLRIAGNVRNSDDTTLCLFFRAKTIATGITQGALASKEDLFQHLPNLLHVAPRSPLMEALVLLCLHKYNVLLLVDGFDEIIEEGRKKVITFLKILLEQKSRKDSNEETLTNRRMEAEGGNEETKTKDESGDEPKTKLSLVIATRTEAASELESSFKKEKVSISKFTMGKFAYDKYFEQLWLKDRAEPPTEVLQNNIKFFIENFDNLLKRAGCKLFLEVPQLCKIMGTIYQERIGKPNFVLHNNYEIGAIYDEFVHCQFAHSCEGYFDQTRAKDAMFVRVLKADFFTRHMDFAYYNQYNRCKNKNLFKDLRNYGLIARQTNSNIDQYEFFHVTLMEYFLVRHVMTDETEDAESVTNFLKFLKRYFCVSRANIADKFIDFFLSDESDCKLSDFKTYALVKYLKSDSRILPISVRTTLNNATFNTLELLLKLAPEAMLQDLCFRFGSIKQGNDADTANEINLKRLGENQTLLLLQALEKSDKGRPGRIMKNLLFPDGPNEEDILEVSIRKPFPLVFDRVVKYCTEQCPEEFGNHVGARLERYAQVLIQHCYAENKDCMVDRITKLCKDRLEHSTVAAYLQSFDLLQVLVDNIEVEPQGKKFIEIDRYDLFGKVLALLDEYSNAETLVLSKRKGRSMLPNLHKDSIKNRLMVWCDTQPRICVHE